MGGGNLWEEMFSPMTANGSMQQRHNTGKYRSVHVHEMIHICHVIVITDSLVDEDSEYLSRLPTENSQ